MPSADKRARKKENARAAREEREAALRRKKRTRSIITAAIVVAIFVGVIILLNALGGDDKKKTDDKMTEEPKLKVPKSESITIALTMPRATSALRSMSSTSRCLVPTPPSSSRERGGSSAV